MTPPWVMPWYQPVALGLVILVSCQPDRREANGPFSYGEEKGVNKNHKLEEASGLAASNRYPGCVWTHNDSGHPAELFLLDSTAKTIATVQLAGTRNRDCEDLALGPGPDGTPWIFLGDIGDNNAKHELKRIYCLPEPSISDTSNVPVARTLFIRLADRPRDTEALMVDPITRNLYLISKRESPVRIYEIAYPFERDTIEATIVGTLPFLHVVAADISPDGTEILVKTYESIYYWKRDKQESILDALKKPFTELPYKPEPQGEAVAWAADGSGYYTLGENAKGKRSRLYYYRRKTADISPR